MKGFGNKLALFLLYLAVAGITFYMYNLRLEQHDSPWDIISRSGAEVPADENLVGKNIISTKRTRNFLLSDIQLVSLIEESTDTFIPVMLNQLEIASKGCSSDFGELDSLLSGSDADGLLMFIHRLLGFAAPYGRKERLNTEVVRFTFFPVPLKSIPDSQQQTPCMTISFIKPQGGSVEEIVSIKGVSRFLLTSSECEEGIAPSR